MMAHINMEELTDALCDNIIKILPHLDFESTCELAEFLIQQGVKNERDLRHITIPLLKEKLSHIDATDLYVQWQNSYATTGTVAVIPPPLVLPEQRAAVHPTQKGRVLSENLQRQARGELKSTMPVFEKDSPYIPASVQEAIAQKKRPTRKGREDMVNRIVDHCRATIPNLQRAMLNSVALQLVTDFPASFKDTLPVTDHGSDSLAKQLRDKYDNDKRPKTSASEKESAAPSCKEAFGCILWNPKMPEGETVATLEKKRVTLLDMHKLTAKQWQWKPIKKNMEETYFLQRKDINGPVAATSAKSKKRKRIVLESENEEDDPSDVAKTISELKGRWPFLFTYKGMNYHFKMLTGIDFRDRLEDFIGADGLCLVEYLATNNEALAKSKRRMIRAEQAGVAHTKLIALVQMVQKYFKEEPGSLFTFVESTTSFEEVEIVASFPEDNTPVIICAGTTLYDTEKFFLSIDNKAVAVLHSFLDAFSMLFSSYFIFSIEYPDKAASSLIFCQKAIAKINSPGTKCKGGMSIHKKASDKVTKFYNKFQEYKEMLEDEENDP